MNIGKPKKVFISKPKPEEEKYPTVPERKPEPKKEPVPA